MHTLLYEPRCEKNRYSGFPTRSDTNRAVQSQKMAGGLKFRIKEVEGLYYPCSENKDADQLRDYREADLCLCFRICKKPVFSRRGSYSNRFVVMASRPYSISINHFLNRLALCDVYYLTH